jgi:hypothetical protein
VGGRGVADFSMSSTVGIPCGCKDFVGLRVANRAPLEAEPRVITAAEQGGSIHRNYSRCWVGGAIYAGLRQQEAARLKS